ncbi:MAG TPA: DUF883 C-terminal domain-containing protein [Pyrinomonadaceae bacterium]|nr:DUF883 C-terminal domain-containing protein [Pyrinomonadaceae bacterium]
MSNEYEMQEEEKPGERQERERRKREREEWEKRTGGAESLAMTAQDYGEKISEAASHARDFVTDKVGVVGDKIKELQNADLGEIAENAKDYARKNPGKAILISAAAGLLVGLIIRGRR